MEEDEGVGYLLGGCAPPQAPRPPHLALHQPHEPNTHALPFQHHQPLGAAQGLAAARVHHVGE